jgi:membrane protein implicated in regulation of membrane protease activity
MNGYLWLGAVSTMVLIASVVLDGFDSPLDALDLGGDWLSVPVIAAFLGAFGFVAGATSGTIGTTAIVPGLIAGVLFALLAVRLSSFIQGAEHSGADAHEALLGTIGQLVTPTTPTTYGEVLLARPNGPLKVACRSASTLAIGTEVVVVDVASSTLVTVEPFNQELLP